MTTNEERIKFFFYVQILYPLSTILYFFISSITRTIRSKKDAETPEIRKPRIVLLALTFFECTLYIAESILLLSTVANDISNSYNDLAFAAFSILTWLILFLGLTDTSTKDISYQFHGSWIIGLLFEVVILLINVYNPTPRLSSGEFIAKIVFGSLRVGGIATLVALSEGAACFFGKEKASDEEVAPLLDADHGVMTDDDLAKPNGHANGHAYGTTHTNGHIEQKKQTKGTKGDNKDSKKSKKDETEDEGSKWKQVNKDWWIYVSAYKLFWPYLWPDTLKLRLHYPGLAGCLTAERLLNVVIPMQIGRIVTALGESGRMSVPWQEICYYVLLRILDSGAGVPLIQSYLWLAIDRNCSTRLSASIYNHLMDLSADFHDSKESGKLWETMRRGKSISGLFQLVGFTIFPMAADLVIAIAVLYFMFGIYMAFIVASAVILFLWSSSKAVAPKNTLWRRYIKNWEAEQQQVSESTLQWMTVSYFNHIPYEKDRYKEKVQTSQGAVVKFYLFYYAIAGIRNTILQAGFLVACCLAACQIVSGKRTVGDFVFLFTYWANLVGPLAYFASGFDQIASKLVDAEKLVDLLHKIPAVRNKETATDLDYQEGNIEFKDVYFSYDGTRQVTNGISFKATSGQTVALVGETGGGKSTLLKLLARFYEITGGSIYVDGQDIRDVNLSSLRAVMGFVPQDPAMFNQTVFENLRYANLEATDDEIIAACKAVALHDKVMSFTNGYEEKVGERGTKLSGGELQRMAIARAILKDPKILMLDEATSAVDSETEAVIQESLQKLCAGRTTFVIAHRLSTIVHADLVLVINEGKIVENGTHKELMKRKGAYNKLWTRQLKLQTGEVAAEDELRSRSQCPTKGSGSPAIFLRDASDDKQESDSHSGDGRAYSSSFQSTGHDSDHSIHRGSHVNSTKILATPMTGSVRTKILRPSSPRRKTETSPDRKPPPLPLNANATEFIPTNKSSATDKSQSVSVPGIDDTSKGTGTESVEQKDKPNDEVGSTN